MQLSEIKTVERAKALAYDCIQRIEIEQNNLRALQARMSELSVESENVPEARGTAAATTAEA